MGVHTIVIGLVAMVLLAQGWLSDFHGNHGVGAVDKGVWCLVGRGLGRASICPKYFEEFVWPFALCPVKPSLELAEDDFVRGFCLAVCLGVLDGTGDVCDFQVAVEFGEAFVYELAAVVSYDGVRDTIAADDVLPDETLYLIGSYGGKGFCLDPFGEVINGDK